MPQQLEQQSCEDSPHWLRLPRLPSKSSSVASNASLHKPQTALALQVRGCMCLLMLIGLIVFELTLFELKDWNDHGQPLSNAFTGPALLWSLSTLWALSQTIHCCLYQFSPTFRGLTPAQQPKVVKYIVQVTWGSATLILYCVIMLYVHNILSSECSSAQDTVTACFTAWVWPVTHAGTLFVAVYIWELIHEGAPMHNSLAVHHMSIVVLFQIAVGYYGTREWITPAALGAIIDTAFPQLVAAGLEQPTFIALLMHRFGASPAARVRAFQASWVSFGFTKALALIATVFVIVIHWSTQPQEFSVAFLVMLFVLVPTQIHSTLVQRFLSKKMSTKQSQSVADTCNA